MALEEKVRVVTLNSPPPFKSNILASQDFTFQMSLVLLENEGQTTSAATPISLPTPGHYHVLYRGCGETQVGWHGETYCLVGGYRAYGDAPVASLEKTEAEKPVSSRTLKRHHALEEPDKELGPTTPKVLRLCHRVGRRLPSQKHSSQAAS